MRKITFALATVLALPLSASAVVLYGPTAGTPLITAAPASWFYAELPIGANVPVTSGSTGTEINSLAATVAPPGVAMNAKAGFSAAHSAFPFTNALVPLLTENTSTGYNLRFSSAVTSETHADRNVIGDPTDDDRAGFSVIALSSNLKGIELGFFTDRIFSQNADFVGRGEQVARNTIPMTTYDLTVINDSYTLASGGTPILSGSLRDYSPFNPALGPYATPDFLFFGDDTTSAGADAEIGAIELTAVPEPASLAVFALGTALLWPRRAQRSSGAARKM